MIFFELFNTNVIKIALVIKRNKLKEDLNFQVSLSK